MADAALTLSTGNRDAVASWVLEKLAMKTSRFFDDFKTIAALDGEKLVGAVVFDSFTFVDCNLHIALSDRRCVTRRTIREIFRYPFDQLNLRRVSVQVSERNDASLEFVQRLGFRLEGRKIDGEGDHDQLLFGMRKSECRWL